MQTSHLLIYIVTALFIICAFGWSMRGRKKSSSHDATTSVVPPPVSHSSSVPGPFLVIASKMEGYLRLLKDEGAPAEVALPEAAGAFPALARLDVADAALKIGFSPADVAAWMDKTGFMPEVIAEHIAKKTHASASGLAVAIHPFIKEEDPAGKIEETFRIVRRYAEVPDSDSRLLGVPEALGATKEEAFGILWRQTDLRVGQLLAPLGLRHSLDTVGASAKSQEIDLANDEDYASLWDEDLEFAEIVWVMFAAGVPPAQILALEDSISPFIDEEEGDTLNEAFQALGTVGVSSIDVMRAIRSADILKKETMYAVIADTALNENVPMEDVAAFLREAGVDADDLDRQMGEENVDMERRFDVKYALLQPAPAEPAPQEPAPAPEEPAEEGK